MDIVIGTAMGVNRFMLSKQRAELKVESPRIMVLNTINYLISCSLSTSTRRNLRTELQLFRTFPNEQPERYYVVRWRKSIKKHLLFLPYCRDDGVLLIRIITPPPIFYLTVRYTDFHFLLAQARRKAKRRIIRCQPIK